MSRSEFSPAYHAQVDLLLQVIPLVAKERCFALKGGTAINMFVWEMPRLSVDIDLTYLPLDDRQTALAKIAEALKRIQADIQSTIRGCRATGVGPSEGPDAKLVCQTANAQIKIEVNTTIRGHLLPTVTRDVVESVENMFGRFVSIEVVSDAELFGGKICAALDRQHPRDLFDMHRFFETSEFTDTIRLGFLAMLLSSPRPIHEMLRPHLLDQQRPFETQFAGMATSSFTYEEFEATRIKLVEVVRSSLTTDDRQFLLSFKSGMPDWSLYPIDHLSELPAIRWKLDNIQQLKRTNPTRHDQLCTLLRSVLDGQ